MTEQALDGSGGGAVTRVLEVGTGSGYQAAVLAEAGCEVWTIEALPELAAEAAARLEALGYDKVHCRQGDGAAGWPQAAPFEIGRASCRARGCKYEYISGVAV